MNEYFTLCNTRRAHVNEFFTLAQQILQAAKEMLAETEAQPRIATYESAVTAFDEALKQSTKNSYTASVELADEAVDETWSALWGMTKVMVKHPNLDRRAAAALVYDIMYKYGNVTKLSYKEEYGRLHNLTQDLDNLGEEKLKLAYVDEWFAELKKRIATYETAEEGRLGEEDARLVGAVKAAREATENALRQFLRQVEALILLNGESDYQAFVARANKCEQCSNRARHEPPTRRKRMGKRIPACHPAIRIRRSPRASTTMRKRTAERQAISDNANKSFLNSYKSRL